MALNPVLTSPVGTELNINVSVKKIIFFNESNYYGVCEVTSDQNHRFVATGKFAMSIFEGQCYNFEGKVVFQRGTKQLAVDKYSSIRPFDKNSMITYLSTLPGIKSKAYDVYSVYGNKSIEMLRNHPEQVIKDIKGIGKKTAKKCQDALMLAGISEKVMMRLFDFGLSPMAARKLYDLFGDDVVNKIEANPYFLLQKVKGYGFNKCDKIAETLGYNMHSLERLNEGIKYTLELAQNDGHCYLPYEELIHNACETLSKRISTQTMAFLLKTKATEYVIYNTKCAVNQEKLKEQYELETKTRHFGIDHRYKIIEITPNELMPIIEKMITNYDLVDDNGNIYLRNIYDAERYVEKKIRIMCKDKVRSVVKINSIIDKIESGNKFKLEPEQRTAIKQFVSFDKGVFVLTGSAGCGKTFTVNSLMKVLKELNPAVKIHLYAPTGKAAKVLKKATKYECKTIHRGLEYSPELGFVKNEFNPIDADVIIVDETSMLDIELLSHFLRAVKNKTKLLFLGDVNQLQSVGCGNVLNDFIKSFNLEIMILSTIKRQGLDSGIIVNANNTINGVMLNNDYPDFNLNLGEDEGYLMDDLINSYMDAVHSGLSIEDIQILTPQKNNSFGTYALNKKLQSMLNTRTSLEIPYKTVGDMTLSFKEGDKVIHIKNNYDKVWYDKIFDEYEPTDNCGIFNGDCGIVDKIYINEITKTKEMVVRYDEKYIVYAGTDFEEIELAYALTIHKSQGSEWEIVIIPMLRQHYAMLNKHILYTAITRARTSCKIHAQKSAIQTALSRSTLQARYTKLDI